ncbi:hypothetical protein PHYC_03639 [Phycisphaerales bacterium]|nr:hypothetical protein PHYC_03639 [Phycisphaerales bacterium]
MRHVAFAAALAASAPALAGIVSISNGGIFHEPPPANIGLPNNSQASVVQGFNEVQNLVLAAGLNVYDPNIPGFTALPAGTVVSSHMLVFDPVQTASGDADITFDGNIIGIIFQDLPLFQTHGLLGRPGVSYPGSNVSAYGFESTESILLIAPNVLRFHAEASSPGDRFRVLTPAPASLFPILGGVLFLRRRR